MRRFISWTATGATVVLVVSLAVKFLAAEDTLLYSLSNIGLIAVILVGAALCMNLQELLDQSHTSLELLIVQAEDKLAKCSDSADHPARTLISEAKALAEAAKLAPTIHVHAGAEIAHLQEGIRKAREALSHL